MRPTVAISMGDPNGVGPELVVLSVKRLLSICKPVVFGSPDILSILASKAGVDISGVDIIDPFKEFKASDWKPGFTDEGAGLASFKYLEAAVDFVASGKADCLVTAPVCKEAINMAGVSFTGHTEFLERKAGKGKAVMMLANPFLRVTFFTTHIPLREVFEKIKGDALLEHIKIVDAEFREKFGIRHPRIGVAALNPHAGEGGLFGNEENFIKQQIERAAACGIKAEGPVPADVVFWKVREGIYDVAVALYHDQGTIAVKTTDFKRGVNITLNLKIIRTSPDHGTAFDIAGKLKVDPASFLEAVRWAVSMVKGEPPF